MKDLDAYLRTLRRQGYIVEKTKRRNHWLITEVDGQRVATHGSTPRIVVAQPQSRDPQTRTRAASSIRDAAVSRYNKVDVSGLGNCCTATVQARVELAAEGDVLDCPACGGRIRFKSGRWARPTAST